MSFAAGPMLDAGEILVFMLALLDNLALSLSGPRLFQSVFEVSWQHFMHTTCQGVMLAGYMEEAECA